MVLALPLRPQRGRGHEFHNFTPLYHRCYKPNLVEIGSVVPEKKLKKFRTEERRRTKTDSNMCLKRDKKGRISDVLYHSSMDKHFFLCKKRSAVLYVHLSMRKAKVCTRSCCCNSALLWLKLHCLLFFG